MLGIARPESPKVVDATGTPLAGRTIAFQLGTWTVSAITWASGVAGVQPQARSGERDVPLTATWTPSGADDAGHDLGSVAPATFKLQAK